MYSSMHVERHDYKRLVHVVITGASTGIGEESAYQYAKLRADLLITARRDKRLPEIISQSF